MTPFKLERYFAQYEFKVRYLLSSSDCESMTLKELLALADDDSRGRWERLALGYTESAGHPALRAEVARSYTTLTLEDVLILTPEEGIYIAMHTLLEAGDHVIALTPAYQSLYEVARSKGCAVTRWELQPRDADWELDLDQLAQSFTPRTRLLVLNFPHNPTGYLPTRQTWESILDLARQHQVYVFSDEMYRGLELDPTQALPAICDVYERGISLSGLSKTYALPGLRIGWLATRQPDLIERWLTFKDYTTICHSAPSEILALMALRAAQTLQTRNLEIVRHNLSHAAQFFVEHAALFRWLPPNAGSIAFPRWLGASTVEAFCQAVLDQRGVMIVPGDMFEYAGPHFRLGLGRSNFPTALGEVREFLKTQ